MKFTTVLFIMFVSFAQTTVSSKIFKTNNPRTKRQGPSTVYSELPSHHAAQQDVNYQHKHQHQHLRQTQESPDSANRHYQHHHRHTHHQNKYAQDERTMMSSAQHAGVFQNPHRSHSHGFLSHQQSEHYPQGPQHHPVPQHSPSSVYQHHPLVHQAPKHEHQSNYNHVHSHQQHHRTDPVDTHADKHGVAYPHPYHQHSHDCLGHPHTKYPQIPQHYHEHQHLDSSYPWSSIPTTTAPQADDPRDSSENVSVLFSERSLFGITKCRKFDHKGKCLRT